GKRELVDPGQTGQVGGAGKGQEDPDDERDPRRALAQLPLPPWWPLLLALRRPSFAPALSKALMTSGVEDVGDHQRDPSKCDVCSRTQQALSRFGGARVMQAKDDQQTEGDADHEGTD